ncbi:MAG: hypothetical protein RML40_05960 [Bacteroidota bacterium]|nr:hypothetical protein [Candidatus Kapabacteria bacterium]MDW8220058.1 hypothetical protein [Bacteroidota bacterium]
MNTASFVPDEQGFYTPIENAVVHVQRLFDTYQKACFQARSPEFFALELCGEAGELANLQKKRWKGKAVADNAIAEETADVFIALMNFANASGVCLGAAVRAKLLNIEETRQRLQQQGELY